VYSKSGFFFGGPGPFLRFFVGLSSPGTAILSPLAPKYVSGRKGFSRLPRARKTPLSQRANKRQHGGCFSVRCTPLLNPSSWPNKAPVVTLSFFEIFWPVWLFEGPPPPRGACLGAATRLSSPTQWIGARGFLFFAPLCIHEFPSPSSQERRAHSSAPFSPAWTVWFPFFFFFPLPLLPGKSLPSYTSPGFFPSAVVFLGHRFFFFSNCPNKKFFSFVSSHDVPPAEILPPGGTAFFLFSEHNFLQSLW